jgi:hypothetical protein
MIDEIFSTGGLTRAPKQRKILIIVMGLWAAFCPMTSSAQSAEFAWKANPSDNVTGYMLYESSDGTNFDIEMDAGTNTSYTVTGIEPGSTNYFEVVAYDAQGDESPPSGYLQYIAPLPPQTLTVQATPASAGNATGGGTFPFNTVVTVSATSATGCAFANWSENGVVLSISSNYSFALTTNCNLIANFTTNPVSYTVTTVASPIKSGIATGGGNYFSGTPLTVMASANSGYTFTAWTANSAVVSTVPSYSFTLSTNINLVANFTANSVVSNTVVTNTISSNSSAATYTVTPGAGANGSISPSVPQIVAAGGSATFTALPASGYQINQWLVNGAPAQTGGGAFTLQNVNTNYAVGVSFSVKTVVTNSTPPVTIDTVNTNFSLLVSGNGNLTPSRVAKDLQEGEKYTLTAVPDKGSIFAGWFSNGVEVASKPKYTFFVESNLVLEASFIPNPFVAVEGAYHGLFYVTNDASEESSGSFVASVTGAGTYVANLRLDGATYSYSGQFSATGTASKSIERPGLAPLAVNLQLDLADGPLTGTISDGTWTTDLVADLAVYSKTNPAPQAGRYTLLIPGSENASTQPGGNGFGAVTVTDSGAVTFSGVLGDGTMVTSAGIVTSEGQWPFYISLYGGKGSIMGWLSFTNVGAIDGQIAWFKLAKPTAKLYPGGFTNSVSAMGSVYNYTNGVAPLGFSSGELLLTNGDLTGSITNQIDLGPESAGTVEEASNQAAVKLNFKTLSGLFKGTVTNPDTGKPIPVEGVVLQNMNLGAGYFLGATESGSVLLTPTQ